MEPARREEASSSARSGLFRGMRPQSLAWAYAVLDEVPLGVHPAGDRTT
jgi:hypothetical protein